MQDTDRLIKTIAISAFCVLVGLTCMTLHHEFDLWWHLKLGEYIAANRAIPFQDTFSYTFAGQRQYAGEWLADLIFYVVFNSWDFIGLNILKSVIILLTFILIALTIKIRVQDNAALLPTVAITLLVVLFAVRFRFFVRPYLFSMLFSALFLYVLETWRSQRRSGVLYLLPLLMLLWANLSVGAVFGTVMVGLAATDDFYRHRSAKLLFIAVLTFVVSLLNPEGVKLYTLALNLTSDPYRVIVPEYRPLSLGILLESGFAVPFILLVVSGLIYLVMLRGSKDLFHLGIYLFFLYGALRQFRLIEIFSIVSGPFFAICVSQAIQKFTGTAGKRHTIIHLCVLVVMLLLIPLTVICKGGYLYGNGVKPDVFPDGALKFLDLNRVSGKMFNSYSFGGYLIWKAPHRPVFIDGRYRRVYTSLFAGEFLGALSSAEGWQEAERKYGFDYAVITYDALSRPYPVHLAENPDWAVVYWDKTAIVAVRRSPDREEFIRNFAYTVSRPTSMDFRYLDKYVREGTIDQAVAQLDVEISRDRENQIPVLAALYLLYQAKQPDYPRILQLLEQIIPLQPDFAMKHSSYAHILFATGQSEKGMRELKKAISLDPADPGALTLSKELQKSNSLQ